MAEMKTTTDRISQIQLVLVPSTDQDRSLAFYEALGFERRNDIPWGDGYRWVEVYPPSGTAGIALVPPRQGDPTGMQTGIILATSIMYLRMLIIVALFNQALAIALAPALLGLAALGLILAGLWYRMSGAPTGVASPNSTPANPLELTAALIFAAF